MDDGSVSTRSHRLPVNTDRRCFFRRDILNITTQTYQELISQSEKPVLVEFTAPWCSYCRRLAPALEQVAREHQEDLLVCQID